MFARMEEYWAWLVERLGWPISSLTWRRSNGRKGARCSGAATEWQPLFDAHGVLARPAKTGYFGMAGIFGHEEMRFSK
jgi:hypothetical protein